MECTLINSERELGKRCKSYTCEGCKLFFGTELNKQKHSDILISRIEEIREDLGYYGTDIIDVVNERPFIKNHPYVNRLEKNLAEKEIELEKLKAAEILEKELG